MSRIDIGIKNVESNALVINRGFCRDTHLGIYCENFDDAVVCDFANRLFLGVSINASNFLDFQFQLSYTIQCLRGLDIKTRQILYPDYKPESLDQFLHDLEESFAFLRSFRRKESDLSIFEIDIY